MKKRLFSHIHTNGGRGNHRSIHFRPAQLPGDLPAIQSVNEQAFERRGAGIFEQLLAANDDVLALVAIRDGAVVGDIIFTPVVIDGTPEPLTGMGLGELAVLPALQRRGIGRALVDAGLEALRALRCPFVIVVGHAAYYPHFGFVPGSRLGLRCQWDRVPDENFMALVLEPDAMAGVTGVARFRDVPA